MNFELETIKKVVDYIEENLNDELNLDKIAEKAGYSKFHLHRIFSKIVGETIHKYIQKRRLTEAARKLVYTDESIIDIALISGYESQQAFTLAFKKMYKSSPQMYRIKKNFEPKQLSIDIKNRHQKLKEEVDYLLKKYEIKDGKLKLNLKGHEYKILKVL